MVSDEPACAARCEITGSNPGLEGVYRGHCRTLAFNADFRHDHESGCVRCVRVPKNESASHVQSLARVKMISMIRKDLLSAANLISAFLLAWMHLRGSNRTRSAKDI